MLASSSLREEGVERIVTASNGLVGWHLAIRLDAVLEAVKLPAGVTGLAPALADVDRDAFTHVCRWFVMTLRNWIRVLKEESTGIYK